MIPSVTVRTSSGGADQVNGAVSGDCRFVMAPNFALRWNSVVTTVIDTHHRHAANDDGLPNPFHGSHFDNMQRIRLRDRQQNVVAVKVECHALPLIRCDQVALDA